MATTHHDHHVFIRHVRNRSHLQLSDRELLLGVVLLQEVLMDQVQELQASVDALSTSVGDLKVRADAHANAFQAKIDELEKQIEAGAAPDLGPLKAEVDGLRTTVESIEADPAPAPPAGDGAAPADEAGAAQDTGAPAAPDAPADPPAEEPQPA